MQKLENKTCGRIITVAKFSCEVVYVTLSALFWVALVLSLNVASLAVLRASCNKQI